MFILREKSSNTGNTTVWFFTELRRALSFIKVIKSESYSKNNTIFLTRENCKDIAIYTGNMPAKIWRF